MRTGIKIRDIMTRKPITCSQNISVLDATKKMLECNVGSLLIISGSELVGILTEKDLIKNVLAKRKDPKNIKISEIMTRNVVTITQDKDITEAAKLMVKKGVRRLPVCENGKLLGLVTEKDLLKIQPSILDVLYEKIQLREETRKQEFMPVKLEGVCEVCGNFSESLEERDGSLICPECIEEIYG